MSLPPYYEEMPQYSPSIELYGLALFKIERLTPWSDQCTNLQPVVVELNSNQLRIYKLEVDPMISKALRTLFKFRNQCGETDLFEDTDSSSNSLEELTLHRQDDSGLFKKLKSSMEKAKDRSILKSKIGADFAANNFLMEPTSSSDEYMKFAEKYRGSLLYSYTLLDLAVGKAPYFGLIPKKQMKKYRMETLLKERNALRLRIEYMQVLLYMWSFHGMVQWYRSLVIGKDLALLLDNRKLLVLKSVISTRVDPNINAFQHLETNPHLKDNKIDFDRRMSTISSGASISDTLTSDTLTSDSSTSDSSTSDSSTSDTSTSGGCFPATKYCLDSGLNKTNYVDIMGQQIYCLEDFYFHSEKKYISYCIPNLNSFDKWEGHKVAVSNFEWLMLAIDTKKLYKNGSMFVLSQKFNKLTKNLAKLSKPLKPSQTCREFYIYGLGLYTCEQR